MPLTGDLAGLRRLERSVESLAGGTERSNLLVPVKAEIIGLLKEQFTKGIAPDGSALQLTARGRAALVSRKLPYAFHGRIDRGGLRFVAKTPNDWIDAQQYGHTFAARSVAANRNFLTFDRRGKLISGRRALNKKGEVRRGIYQRFAAAHTIKQRVLPPRQMIPEASLPARYEVAIEHGITAGVERWAEKAQR